MEFRTSTKPEARQKVPTKLLVELMAHVLENNIFNYDQKLYLQLISTAMGTEAAVNYANLFIL